MTSRDVKQHKSLEDRKIAAKGFLEDFSLSENLPLYIDLENDPFNTAYASWPFRFWVLTQTDNPCSLPDSPKVSFKPMPEEASYDFGELDHWLEEDSQRRGV
mmetsp:Transcript_41299/g.53299  ORF Transcript_41299/g.53299 Transcript_41299/m.53299 type:complete len:102 (-) Transcript_41299:298-603(-)